MTYIYAQAGVMLSRAAVLASESSLTGFEFAGGIPGSIGGAVSMNAGAYGGEIKDVIVSADVLMEDGSVVKMTNKELELSYKAFSISSLDFIIVKQEYKQERTIVNMIKIIKVLFLFLVIYAIAFFITFLTTPFYFLTP